MPFLRTLFCLVVLAGAPLSRADFLAWDAAQKLSGRYVGQWTLYSWSESAQAPQERARWSDELTIDSPVIADDRVCSQVLDEQVFSDGAKRSVRFVEGFLTNPDGTAGARFFEMPDGERTVLESLAEGVWAFATTPAADELWWMGFDPATVLRAKHVTTKTRTWDASGVDTEFVTRITLIQWRENDRALKTAQFTSLTGRHERQ